MVNTTENPASEIDEQAFSVRRTIRIAAPPEKVWTAVTDPQQISRWFGEASISGSEVGAIGTLSWPDHGSIPFRIEAIDEPRLVTYRWNDQPAADPAAPLIDDASTVFTFTLEPHEGGTQLTVIETGFENTSDPIANLEDHRGGWNSELDELVALLESAA